jgi:hypothetical protein
MKKFNNVCLPNILELNSMLPHLKEDEFELDADYPIFWDDQFGRPRMLVVPRGYVTDLSSIPRWARSAIPVVGRQNGPSVIHDYIYEPCDNDRPEGQHQYPGWTKAEADYIFLLAMKSVGVNIVRRRLMYWAVKYGGRRAWRTKDK